MNNTDNQNLYCNIITPPSDSPEDQFPSVLIFDADWDAIEDVVLWCRTCPECYNIYLYEERMNDLPWLMTVLAKVDNIIIHTNDNSLNHVKIKMSEGANSWHYGPNPCRDVERKIERPVDWFKAQHG